MNIQGWFPLRLTSLISSKSKGLSRVFSVPQFESINSSMLSLLYGPTLNIHTWLLEKLYLWLFGSFSAKWWICFLIHRKIPQRRAWQPTPVLLPGESPWTEERGGLQSMGSHRVGHDWATKHSTGGGRAPVGESPNPIRLASHEGDRVQAQPTGTAGPWDLSCAMGKRKEAGLRDGGRECSPAATGRGTPEILPAHSQKPGRGKEASSRSLQEERDPPDNLISDC